MGAADPAVTAVTARRLPIVTAGSPRLPGVPFVGIDNRKAGALAARHLLELGTDFGVVTLRGRDMSARTDAAVPVRLGSKERVAGFVRELSAAGVAGRRGDRRGCRRQHRRGRARAGYELLHRFTAGSPTAVFAVTDVLALGVLAAVADLGWQVPRDVSVVGFDDIPEAAGSEPGLTTVSQSLYEQGQSAARMALDLVAGREVRSPRITAELVVRQSTAPPRRPRG